MKNTNITFIIFLIVIIAVFASGCTVPIADNANITVSNDGISFDVNNSSSISENLNNTFSKGGITFNYPSNWFENGNISNQEDILSHETLGMLNSPDGDNIVVERTAILDSVNNSLEKYKNITKKEMEDAGATTLNESTKTVNGLRIYEL